VSLSPFPELVRRSLTVTVDCSRQTRLLRLRNGETEVNEDGPASGGGTGKPCDFKPSGVRPSRAFQKAEISALILCDLSPPISPRRNVVSPVYLLSQRHLRSWISTTSRLAVPRSITSCLPSRDRSKLRISRLLK